MNNTDRLIFGKDPQSRVVGLEPGKKDQVELFIQNDDGSIRSEFVPNKWWLLASQQIDKNFIRLAGNLHYKWGRQFKDQEHWSKAKFAYGKNNDIYVAYDPKEACMLNKGLTYYKGLKPKDVSILSFDIETTGFQGAYDRLLLISNTYRDHAGNIQRKLFAYDAYGSEGAMMTDWIGFVQETNPSIICGHNIYGFDLPFLRDVARREGITLALGRNGSDITFAHKDSEKRKDGSQSISYKRVRCYGRELIDTMFLAITYDVGRKYESYGLKKIIEQEGIRFEGRVMYDAGMIKDHYQDPIEWEKIKQYCIYDSDEALQLFDLMAPSLFYWAMSCPKSFQSIIESATGSQLNAMMVRSYLQEAHSVAKADEAVAFEGAISLASPGIYKNCLRWDVASLYPSIIRQYNINLGDKDPNKNFNQIVEFFTVERLKNKKLAKETGDRSYDDLQNSMKIAINSLYGFLGATGLNFNFPRGAAQITAHGREILEKAIYYFTKKRIEDIAGPKEVEDNE